MCIMGKSSRRPHWVRGHQRGEVSRGREINMFNNLRSVCFVTVHFVAFYYVWWTEKFRPLIVGRYWEIVRDLTHLQSVKCAWKIFHSFLCHSCAQLYCSGMRSFITIMTYWITLFPYIYYIFPNKQKMCMTCLKTSFVLITFWQMPAIIFWWRIKT